METQKNTWQNLLADEFKKDYYLNLEKFLVAEYQTKTIFPNRSEIYDALRFTDFPDVKVVILGQDPYHRENQAHGLSFSVKPHIQPPPSLMNIYKELHADLGIPFPKHGYLKKWADQGVLLLNTVLTVREGQANSHKNIGWETFTDQVIDLLNHKEDPIVFMLWGKNAQSKGIIVSNPRHLLLSSPHPSPLSAHRGFFGSKPFSKANAFLASVGKKTIDWALDSE
jgi:uracil-DNA glycosylase